MIPRTREALALLLSKTFPDSQDIDAGTVDAFVDALMRARLADVQGRTERVATEAVASEQLVYRLRATHARRTPVTSVFTGEIETARVALPQDVPVAIETPVGAVLPEDHLLPTVAALRERFGARITRSFDRVELVAPPRVSGVRFAPMSLYLGYAKEDSRTPVFVVFEPGSATGKPMALYLACPHDAIVDEPAGYVPTPFSSADYWYTGGVRMAPNGRDPAVLFMRAARERGGDPYLRLHVEYELVDTTTFQRPDRAMLEAVLRVCAIKKGMALDQTLIEAVLADMGLWTLPWVDRPDNGPVPAPGGSDQDFRPSTAFDAFIESLPEARRRLFQRSVVMLLAEVVHADGKFDRLERVEADWIMNFEVPAALGNAFRSSDAADEAYRALFDGTPAPDGRPLDERLADLTSVVDELPEGLRSTYTAFVARVCRAAAESSGTWLWFGTRVSEEEKAILDRIAKALKLGAVVSSPA